MQFTHPFVTVTNTSSKGTLVIFTSSTCSMNVRYQNILQQVPKAGQVQLVSGESILHGAVPYDDYWNRRHSVGSALHSAPNMVNMLCGVPNGNNGYIYCFTCADMLHIHMYARMKQKMFRDPTRALSPFSLNMFRKSTFAKHGQERDAHTRFEMQQLPGFRVIKKARAKLTTSENCPDPGIIVIPAAHDPETVFRTLDKFHLFIA